MYYCFIPIIRLFGNLDRTAIKSKHHQYEFKLFEILFVLVSKNIFILKVPRGTRGRQRKRSTSRQK